MKPLVALVSAWQSFADEYPGADVESFCYHYLSKRKGQGPGNQALNDDRALAKLIGKTSSLFKTHLKVALRQVPGMELEWFYFLDTIIGHQEIRKKQKWSVSCFYWNQPPVSTY